MFLADKTKQTKKIKFQICSQIIGNFIDSIAQLSFTYKDWENSIKFLQMSLKICTVDLIEIRKRKKEQCLCPTT